MRIGFIPLFNQFYSEQRIFAANGLAYIAANLREKLGLTDVFVEVTPQRLFEQKPDLIGISCTTQDFNRARRIAQYAKQELGIPVIMGGIHISSLPHILPPEMDLGVIGEGEQTMVEIAQLYMRGDVSPENLAKINGIVFHDAQGRYKMTPPRQLEKDLDVLPLPRRDLFQSKDGNWYQSISTSRGCYYDCVFCSAATYWETVRYHSPEYMLQDIEAIIRAYPQQKCISIDDLLFGLNKKRLRRVVELIRDAGIHKKVSFVCTARASGFTEEIAALLKGMNVHSICFGYESPLDRVVKYLKGPSANMETNIRSMDLCRRYGLRPVGNYIVGTPIETLPEMAKTYWIVRNNSYRHTPNIFYMNPLPGTAQWHQCVADGFVSDSMADWSVLDMIYERGRTIFLNQHYSEDDFEQMYPLFKALEPGPDPLKSLQEQRRSEYCLGQLQQVAQYLTAHPEIKNVVEISEYKERLIDVAEDLGLTDIEVQRLLPEDLKAGPDAVLSQADLVLFVHALEQFADPISCLEQIASQLKPGAYCWMLVYNAQHISLLAELLLGRWEPAIFGVYQEYHLRFYSEKALHDLMQKTGYKVVHFHKNRMPIGQFKALMDNLAPLFDAHLESAPQWQQLDVVSYGLLLAAPVRQNSPQQTAKSVVMAGP